MLTIARCACIVVLCGAACKSEEGARNESGFGATPPSSTAPGGPAIAEAASAKPRPTLTPDAIDPAKPVAAAELQRAYFAWKGKRVAVAGYCQFFFEDGAIGDCGKITGEPGGKQTLVTTDFKFGEGDPAKWKRATPVVVRGTIEDWIGDDVRLKDCELVSRDAPPPTETKLDPLALDDKTPVSASALHASYFGWRGKEVSVAAVYHSTTTSTTSYGKTIRVDLADGSGLSANKSAACEVAEPLSEEITRTRNVVMRGTIKGAFFDQVLLEKCAVVSAKP